MAHKVRRTPTSHSESKRRLPDRLIAFKINLENNMKPTVARKLYQEQQRKWLAKLPSLKEREAHFLTHLPYALWRQACVATKAREDRREQREEKPGQTAEALSSGESEFVAGSSDGLLVQCLWKGESCDANVRSDGLAAQRQEQWCRGRALVGLGAELDCAGVGTKNLTEKRAAGTGISLGFCLGFP